MRWFGWFRKKSKDVASIAKKEINKVLDMDSLRSEIESELRRTFISKANEKINLPILNERQEAVLIGLAYDIVVGVVKKQINR